MGEFEVKSFPDKNLSGSVDSYVSVQPMTIHDSILNQLHTVPNKNKITKIRGMLW